MGNQEWSLRVDVHQLRGRQRLVSLCNAERDSHAGQQHLELHEYSSQTDDENSDQVKCEVWIIAIILACVSFIGYVAVKYLGASRGYCLQPPPREGSYRRPRLPWRNRRRDCCRARGSRFGHHRDGETAIRHSVARWRGLCHPRRSRKRYREQSCNRCGHRPGRFAAQIGIMSPLPVRCRSHPGADICSTGRARTC